MPFGDPFDPLFRFQRTLDQQLESDWLGDLTTGTGAFPPIGAIVFCGSLFAYFMYWEEFTSVWCFFAAAAA